MLASRFVFVEGRRTLKASRSLVAVRAKLQSIGSRPTFLHRHSLTDSAGRIDEVTGHFHDVARRLLTTSVEESGGDVRHSTRTSIAFLRGVRNSNAITAFFQTELPSRNW
jgi:hypothetical protein